MRAVGASWSTSAFEVEDKMKKHMIENSEMTKTVSLHMHTGMFAHIWNMFATFRQNPPDFDYNTCKSCFVAIIYL